MKYWILWFHFLKISWMAEAEYRFNMFVRVISDVIWYITQLSIFEVLFYHVPQIAGWDIVSMRVFMGILFIVDAVFMIIFYENFENASSMVRKGELDFILTKPINSQFMFSMRKANVVYGINLLLVLAYTAWAITKLPHPPAVAQYFVTFGLMICGIAVLYAVRFFFAALTVLLTNAQSLTYVWYQLYRLGNRPHALYPPWLRWCLLTILPVGLIMSVPASNLVNRLEPQALWLSPLIAGFLFYLSTRYWNYVLKYYSSASS
jgi:ABC-2 type transport system permease protein